MEPVAGRLTSRTILIFYFIDRSVNVIKFTNLTGPNRVIESQELESTPCGSCTTVDESIVS